MNARQGFQKAETCYRHNRPRAECPPEQVHNYSYGFRGDLHAAAEKAAAAEHITVTEFISRAIAERAHFEVPPPPPPAPRRHRYRYQVEKQDDGTVVLHPVTRATPAAAAEPGSGPALTMKEELFAVTLENATGEHPVTGADLEAATGTESSNSYVPKRLAIVKRAGAVGWRKEGRAVFWWALPGADIRAAMRGVPQEGAVTPQEAPAGQSPAPAPRKRSAQAKRAGKGKNAATKETPRKRRAAVQEQAPAAPRPPVAAESRESVITELKARVPDLVTASELPVPVFLAGPDVDCVHENMRLRKGVCPDCKQWVTKP